MCLLWIQSRPFADDLGLLFFRGPVVCFCVSKIVLCAVLSFQFNCEKKIHSSQHLLPNVSFVFM